MASTDPCDFTVVLVGILGAGKSSTGNLLLAKDFESGSFRTGRGLQSVTTSCSAADSLVQGDFGTARLRVIDMPGLDDPGKGAEDMMAVFREVQEHAPSGVDVFLLVTPETSLRSFGKVQEMLLFFCGPVLERSILVLTGCRHVDEEMLQSLEPGPLQYWARSARQRILCIDRKKEPLEAREKLLKLLMDLRTSGAADPRVDMRRSLADAETWLRQSRDRSMLLPEPWRGFALESIQDASVRLDRQCIVPEVSRCYPYGPPQSMDDPSLRRSDRTAFDDFMRPVLWNKAGEEVELGQLDRMKDRAYEKLFLVAWPNDEGLAHSRPVASFRDLLDLEMGTHHIILDEQSSGWTKAAHFLRLPERMEKDQTIPGSYQNVLRLRWGGAVLYVVFKGSKLLSAAGIRSNVSGFQDIPRQRPVLLAGVASVVVSRLGASCAATCSELETGARCHDPDLIFLNACSALRHFMGHEACGECIAGDGQEYPSVVLFDTQLSGSAPHFNAKVRNKLFFANSASFDQGLASNLQGFGFFEAFL
ncbi:IAN7 [Symbiodinium sp. CCMP2592]|nr:IAN7 [Symbiodinium sp. CCMP2592]